MIVTPGPDTMLTVRNTLLSGRNGGIATALGVVSGTTTDPSDRRLSAAAAYRRGLLSNLGNPKVAVDLLGHGMVFAVFTLGWLSLYAVVVAKFGDVLRRPAVRRAVEGLTGAVLLAFGLKLATEQR
ncbi:MAG: hypothetical protein JOZ47_19875 [Kutzneria sp.]|nr:hypothetical protein [Kutzneria sp.]MBV9847303.1 hypothetical protein [Kutzneria sp.]